MVWSGTLGDYLRARRELVRPDEVGLPDDDHRPRPGLRREEVALLAGISPEYYLRLEQGRDHHPSDQVLDSIARVLRLDTDASAHLRQLARPRPRRRPSRPERVGRGVQDLIDAWTTTPAYVHGRHLDVLAANPLAVALSPHFAPGANVLRAMFLEPAMRSFYRDWEVVTGRVVPYLRSLLGADVEVGAELALEVAAEDPRLVTLVGELSLGSERFRTLWARHDRARPRTSGLTRLLHPQVGPLDLHHETFTVAGAGQVLTTFQAEAGSASEERLHLLGSLTEPSEPARRGTR